MKFRSALLAATVLGLGAPVVAMAQPVDGLYIAGGAGASMAQNEHVKSVTVPQVRPGLNLGSPDKRFNIGFSGVGSVGYGFGNGVRVEVEGNYGQNGLHKVAGFGGAAVSNAGGDQERWGGGVNAFYDFDLTPYGVSFLMPYVGAGVGYDNVSNDNVHISGPGFFIRDTGNQSNLYYQGIVGTAIPLNDVVPGLAVTAEYRFIGQAFDTTTKGQIFTAAIPGGTREKESFTDQFNHTVLVGLRYAFNQAPPAPPPAVAPIAPVAPHVEVARTYLVFFDWDRADLTMRARQIIGEAAQASTRVQTTRIDVSGYTDLSGTASYNQHLSVRRAQSVAAELVRDGVARNEIVVQGFGESNPLVPTAKGVREPQNRRVEIVLH
jgi:OOP family OmpA-OmpF porin